MNRFKKSDMRTTSGLSFADVLILLALVLLVVGLAIPFFRRNPELSEEEILGQAVTDAVPLTNSAVVDPTVPGR